MMKNVFIGLLVFLLVFSFIGCKDDDGNDNESENNNSGNNPIPDQNWNWTAVEDTTFGYTSINGVAFGNNTWIAVGYEKIAYSNNGEIWTSVNQSFTGISFQAVTFGNNTWIAVGNKYDGSYTGIAAYSSNGLYWTIVDIDVDIGFIYNIAYANTRWIAVGQKYDNINYNTIGKMIYSDDNGASWTEVLNTTFDNTIIYSIAYGNNKWVAGGDYGKIAYSIDGVNSWISVDDSIFNNFYTIGAIGYGNDRFIAACSDNGKIAYSSNGETWSELSMNINNFGRIFAITYKNNRWVVGGYNMAYSNNGINWIQVTNSTFGVYVGTSNFINDIAFGNNKWVAVGSSTSISPLGKISYANQ